jgi:hypothetical protein
MKNNQQRVAGNSISSLYKSEETPKEFAYHTPPGTKFSDILMDVQEVPGIAHEQAQGVQPAQGRYLIYTSLSNDGKAYFSGRR